MEEKERYELFGEHCIKDNNPDARCQLLNAYVACVILNEQDKENQQLKQQLAKKEQEIEKYRDANMIVVGGRSQGKKHLMEIKIKELQNQKAIEQLEKVKDIINASVRDDHIIWDFDIKEQIDQQINELKGKVVEYV